MKRLPYLASLLAHAGLFERGLQDGRSIVRCPFCGGQAVVNVTRRSPHGHVYCASCGHKSIGEVIAVIPAEARRHALDEREHTSGALLIRRELDATVLLRVTAADAEAALALVIEDGKTCLVRFTPGGGKTWLTVDIAAKKFVPHGRVAIVVPTHKLARKIVDQLAQLGVIAKYVQPTLQVLDADGRPACKIKKTASALASSGLRTRRDVCLGKRSGVKCPYLSGCVAFKSTPSKIESNLLIVSHQLMSMALEHVGDAGLLIIDETPPLTDHEPLSAVALRAARSHLGAFHDGPALSPILHALATGLAAVSSGTWENVLSSGVSSLEDDADWRDFVAKAGDYFQLDALSTCERVVELVRAFVARNNGELTPVLKAAELIRARDQRDAQYAREIGDAIKTLTTVVRLVTERPPTIVKHDRILVLFDAVTVRSAFNRTGGTIVLDATGDNALLGTVAGRSIEVWDAPIEDGAPISREVLYSTRMNRRHVCVRNKVTWHDGLLGAVRSVVHKAIASGFRKMAIITFKPVAELLHAAWHDDTTTPASPVLNAWRSVGGELSIMHFGLVRGLDDVKDCDVIATIGDPWPNRDALEDTCTALGVEPAFEPLWRLACRNELEQAHGRLRAPRRTRPALAIHVGAVPPASWGPEVRVETMPRGRPRGVRSAMAGETLKSWRLEQGLSLGKAAAVLGASKSALARYESDVRPVPVSVTEAIEKLGGVGPSPRVSSPNTGTEIGEIAIPDFGDGPIPGSDTGPGVGTALASGVEPQRGERGGAR